MITYRTAFTPETAARLVADGTSDEARAYELPPGLWLGPGDLFADDRFSPHTFMVLSRLFHWDDDGNLVFQLMLEIAVSNSERSDGPGATILPFTR